MGLKNGRKSPSKLEIITFRMQLIGTIEAKVDQKGRVFMPAPFRRVLALTQSDEGAKDGDLRLVMRKDVFEQCLVLYPERVWNERLDQLRSRLSVWRRRDQEMLRSYLSDAEWLTLDSNGRFLMPKRYLQMTGIESDVTFVGMNDTVEVWATPLFRQKQESVDIADGIEEAMG